jgi:hypothetical protein
MSALTPPETPHTCQLTAFQCCKTLRIDIGNPQGEDDPRLPGVGGEDQLLKKDIYIDGVTFTPVPTV